MQREAEGEDVVRRRLQEAVERVEGVGGERRGDEPLVVLLVQQRPLAGFPLALPRAPPPVGLGPLAGGRAPLDQAMALQILLGPPVARRARGIGRGPSPMWRRRRL